MSQENSFKQHQCECSVCIDCTHITTDASWIIFFFINVGKGFYTSSTTSVFFFVFFLYSNFTFTAISSTSIVFSFAASAISHFCRKSHDWGEQEDLLHLLGAAMVNHSLGAPHTQNWLNQLWIPVLKTKTENYLTQSLLTQLLLWLGSLLNLFSKIDPVTDPWIRGHLQCVFVLFCFRHITCRLLT